MPVLTDSDTDKHADQCPDSRYADQYSDRHFHQYSDSYGDRDRHSDRYPDVRSTHRDGYGNAWRSTGASLADVRAERSTLGGGRCCRGANECSALDVHDGRGRSTFSGSG
jgi:hypothetical protein